MGLDDIAQNIDCPFGRGKVIIAERRSDGTYGKCLVAAEMDRLYGVRGKDIRENNLRDAGCPRPKGNGLFQQPDCRFNYGTSEKI